MVAGSNTSYARLLTVVHTLSWTTSPVTCHFTSYPPVCPTSFWKRTALWAAAVAPPHCVHVGAVSGCCNQTMPFGLCAAAAVQTYQAMASLLAHPGPGSRLESSGSSVGSSSNRHRGHLPRRR